MFQLIVAVISIALIAALAIASIFYGGDAFTKSSEKANVTTLVNQAQQIAGAAALYKTDFGVNVYGADPSVAYPVTTGSTLLTEKYLANAPTASKVASGDWEIVDGRVTIALAANADKKALCEGDGTNKGVIQQQGALCLDGTGAVVEDNTGETFAFPL